MKQLLYFKIYKEINNVFIAVKNKFLRKTVLLLIRG